MSEDRALGEVVIGSTWLFISSLTISLTGFLFWVLISRVSGVGTVGSTSAAISAAGVSTTLVAAGLPLASLREFASSGIKALKPSITVASILGAIAALLAYLLASFIPKSFGVPNWISPALALLTIYSSVVTGGLVGLGLFKKYFTTTLGGSLAKLFIGVSLALTGLGLTAPLAGYVTYPIVALVISLCVILIYKKTWITHYKKLPLKSTSIHTIIKLALSNYPFAFSSQLINMLSVYFFAALTSESVATGTLYMSLMIVLVIASINTSIINASLSVGVRRDVDPFTQALRGGLAVSVPLAVAIGLTAKYVLWIINPGLIKGTQTLTILILTIPAMAVTTASIAKLNKERQYKEIAIIGISRLVSLLFALPILARAGGSEGVAIAYLIANSVPLPLAIKYVRDGLKAFSSLWLFQAIAMLIGTELLNNTSVFIDGLAAATLTMITVLISWNVSKYEIAYLRNTLLNNIIKKRLRRGSRF